ncbi:MAG: alanine racemase [Pseudobdellovibrionaceae bacterium]
MRFRSTRALIHLDHLAHNVRELRQALGPANPFFCPMVKANGYGHGDVEISKKLESEGVQVLGVGLIEEGILLREMGIRTQLLFFGTCDEKGAKAVLEYNLTPVLSTWDQIRALESAAKKDVDVHLKFDTGMHRLGFSLKDLDRLSGYFAGTSHLKLKGILTHLHTGEDANLLNGSSFDQLREFQEVEKAFQSHRIVSHTLNSAGLLNFLKHQNQKLPHGISPHQGVRPGLAVYGLAPVPTNLDLKPVMSLRSETVKYHFVRKGEGVSYNTTWKAPQDSVVAVVPIGYADGYHRMLSNRGELLFRGQKVPLVGNVCMDYLMIDVTKTLKNEIAENLKPESVTLFGADESGHAISANELALKAQTISWEILTSVGERVPREVDV